MKMLWMAVAMLLLGLGTSVLAKDINVSVGFTEASTSVGGAALTDLLEHNIVVKDAQGTEIGSVMAQPASGLTGGQPISVIVPVTVADHTESMLDVDVRSVDTSGNESTPLMGQIPVDSMPPDPPSHLTITTTVITTITVP